MPHPLLATFSIAAVDTLNGEFALASCSNYLAVGPLVLHSAAPTGVLLSQSRAHPEAATKALAHLQQAPDDVAGSLACYLADDALREQRQVAILNAKGQSAVFSGNDCVAAVEHYQEPGLVVLGNMLVAGTIEQMVATFKRKRQQQPLAESCLAALQAGAKQGGDKRGKLAAALQTWLPQRPAYQQLNVRVDASVEPLSALADLVTMHRLYHPLTTLSFASCNQPSAAASEWLQQLGFPSTAEARTQWLQQHNLAHHFEPERNALSSEFLHALPVLVQLLPTQQR